jgi:hypothetical protein
MLSTLTDAGARVVRLASRARGERVIHAKGRAYDATLVLLPGADTLAVPLVRGPRKRPVLVRFSRGAGLPDNLPDVLGLAVRIPDADGHGGVQDLLMSTAGRQPGWRQVPWPSRDLLRSTYSSLVTYDVAGSALLVGTVADDEAGATDLERLRGRTLLLATADRTGRWEPFARLVIGAPLSDEAGRRIGFDVAHDAGGFRPQGPFRSLRAKAYPQSRAVER